MLRLTALLFVFATVACAQAGGDGLGEQPGPAPDASTNDSDGDHFDKGTDCNDNNAAIHPGADELCDGVDQDCDGQVDEDAVDLVAYYVDADGDGYGDPDTEELGCSVPAGFVADGNDCYDQNADARPGQAQHFTVHRGDGSFDYNCTGAIESSIPQGNCEFNGTDCGFVAGWDGSPPSCGTTGTVLDDCLTICIGLCFCEDSTSSAVNECR